jgi:hypothetical protein
MAPSVPPKSYLEQLIAYRIAARWHIPSIADALPLTDQPFPEKHFARVFLAKLDKLAEVEPDVGIAREKIRSAMSKRLATRCATQKFGYVITADLTNVLKDYGRGPWVCHRIGVSFMDGNQRDHNSLPIRLFLSSLFAV